MAVWLQTSACPVSGAARTTYRGWLMEMLSFNVNMNLTIDCSGFSSPALSWCVPHMLGHPR